MQPLISVDLIHDHFDNEGVERLCVRLKVDYEDLPGPTRFKKVLSLCKKLARNGRLLYLFLELKRQLPGLKEYLPLCLHEFIAEQCATEQKLTNLFTVLNLEIQDFPNLQNFPVGEVFWRADKAEKLQTHMAETGQWDRLLQVLAQQTDDHITLAQLRSVFAHETETDAPETEPPTPAERPFSFDPFLGLDFVPQHAAYHQHVGQPVAAFAILGLPNTKLKWSLRLLLKRLLTWTTTETAVTRMMPDVDFLPDDPDVVWKQIASTVGLGQAGFSFPLSDDDKRKIAQGVFNRLKTQHVIFIFEGLNDALAQLLIHHFWQKLVAEVETLRQNSGDSLDTKLFAFLVDNRGQLSNDTFNALPAPTPVVLPPVPHLTQADVLNWLFVSASMGNCDPHFREFAHKPQAAERVLEMSQGVPDKVLEYVCAQCGYDYYGEFNNWLQS